MNGAAGPRRPDGGSGPVAPEKDEPIFHADWEKRALGMTLVRRRNGLPGTSMRAATRGRTAIRSTTLPRPITRSGSRGWSGCSSATASSASANLPRAGRSTAAPQPKRVLRAADVPAVLARGGPCDRPVGRAGRASRRATGSSRIISAQRATPGCRVARGKRGVIEAVREGYVFPDTNAHGQGREPAMGLHRRLRRARDLGRRRRPDAVGLDRRLGELP